MKVDRKKIEVKDVEDFIRAAETPANIREHEATKNLIVSVPVSFHRKLKQLALDEETTVKILVQEALTDFFIKRGNQ